MRGPPNAQHEILAATNLEWRHHPYNSFKHLTGEKAEREHVGRRHFNGSAAPSLEHQDWCIAGIAHRSRAVFVVTLDVDGGDELVEAPNLSTCPVRGRRGDWKVRHINCRNRLARRRRPE